MPAGRKESGKRWGQVGKLSSLERFGQVIFLA